MAGTRRARPSGPPPANPRAAIQDWLNLVEPDGAFLTTTELLALFPHGFEPMPAENRTELRSRAADLDTDATSRSSLRRWLLETAFEWKDQLADGQQIPPTAIARVAEHGIHIRPDSVLLDVDEHSRVRLGLFVWPLGTHLDRRTDVAVSGDTWSASPIQRAETWCRESDVPLALVTDDDHWTVVATAGLGLYTPYCEGNVAAASPLTVSDPVADPAWAHANNPVDLAGNFGGLSTWFASGNQAPCDAVDDATLVSFFPFAELEGWVHETTDTFDAALIAAGVAHTYDSYGCGLHSWRYFTRDLHAWWPVMTRALGSPPPASFDYRSTDPTFSVYGWTVQADAARAGEFLNVSDASSRGVGLTGSGITTVTTPPLFAPNQPVLVDTSAVVADASGRITFTVDLGPAHTLEQYTTSELVLEAAGGYFTTRAVTFTPT